MTGSGVPGDDRDRVDLYERIRSGQAGNGEDGDRRAMVALNSSGCGERGAGVDAGDEVDRQFDHVPGARACRDEHGREVSHRLGGLFLDALDELGLRIGAVLAADIDSWPAGAMMTCARAGLWCSSGGSTWVRTCSIGLLLELVSGVVGSGLGSVPAAAHRAPTARAGS